MKTYKKETVLAEKVSSIKCNICGNEIGTDRATDYLSVEKRWGYGSSFDNEVHSFDICENCYKQLILKFKLPVKAD